MRIMARCFGCTAEMGRIGALKITIAIQEGERGMATRQAILLCWRCARQRDLVLRLGEAPTRRLFMQPNRAAAARAAVADSELPPPAIMAPRAS
jgi:hypothetical protein